MTYFSGPKKYLDTKPHLKYLNVISLYKKYQMYVSSADTLCLDLELPTFCAILLFKPVGLKVIWMH